MKSLSILRLHNNRKEISIMKKIYRFILTSVFVLSLSISAFASAEELPLITSGYTDEGIYYEVHGETASQRSADSQYVVRYVTYSGKVNPQSQLSWNEIINGRTYTGTLSLTEKFYDKSENITMATYAGTLTAQ